MTLTIIESPSRGMQSSATKFKVTLFVEKIMTIAFWETINVLIIEYIDKRRTINSASYTTTIVGEHN